MKPTRSTAVRRCYELGRRRCRTLATVRVLDYLYWCYCRFGRATPSRAQIASNTGYCERTVTRAVGTLEAMRALSVWRDPPRKLKNGTYTRARTNFYRLTWPKNAAKPQVAPTGHSCHLLALQESDSTGGLLPPPPVSGPMTLPPEPEEAKTMSEHRQPCECPKCMAVPLPLEAAEAPVVAPPWTRAGITRAEWIARQR